MIASTFTPAHLLTFINVAVSSIVVILAFSLLAYTFTYNFRNSVARTFALLLGCIMVVFASDVALDRIITADSADRWLRFQWLGIALLPIAYYLFSLAVLTTTNYRIGRRRWVAGAILLIGVSCAINGLGNGQLVDDLYFAPPLSYLDAGPYFWLFALYFALAMLLSLRNVWKARSRCLTESSRQRMNYLLLGFLAPGIGSFPYLILLSKITDGSQLVALVIGGSILINLMVAALLVVMSYTVAYFGVLTPDRVVRYRLIRFFMRGPAVAIVVILAVQTLPTVERILGLPRDIVLFSVITGVIISSQLVLSVTKTWVDWLVYREDRSEIAWLRELDRRLLTTSDLRQFLENNLSALCELLRVPAGFVAAVVGPDLILEATVGPDKVRDRITKITDWSEALNQALKQDRRLQPISHEGFWLWPLVEITGSNGESATRVLGILGVKARTETPLLGQEELSILTQMLTRLTSALADRKLQQGVFVSLRRIIPEIDRIQQWRSLAPYSGQESDTTPMETLLDPSPIHSPEFESWVKDALSHYWGGPKLTLSPLVRLRIVGDALDHADGDPTKALRLVLGSAIEKLRPDGKPNLSAPEWLLYNILEMRFIEGRKVREIADRLAMSESDLYRKQRVAIGHVARVLTEMEQENGVELETRPPVVTNNGGTKALS